MIASNTAIAWDRQFSAGEWNYLKGLDEIAHHSLIAGYLAHLAAERVITVLDVACGEGLLRKFLPPGVIYSGVDWSAVAIAKARADAPPETVFEVADVENHRPNRPEDAFLFNECLYYFSDPAATLRRYGGYLNEGGVLVVSMYSSPGNDALWARLADAFAVLDEVALHHAKGDAPG